jgi:hypothetical protein
MRLLRRTAHLLAGTAVTLLVMAGTATAATPAVPYQDVNAIGSIGLCNQAGQQITSGSITDAPFAWRAVSTEPAPAPYNDAWRTATLFAYQPQQGLEPTEWSGEELTASSRYTNPSTPMAAATPKDESFQGFLSDYPLKWDGFVQLRIYLSTQNQPAYSLHYPTLDIWVNGDTWTAVGGAPVDCRSGSSESLETVVLPSSTTTTKPATGDTSPTSSAGGTQAPAAGTKSGSSSTGLPGSDAGSVNSATDTSHASSPALKVVALVVALVAIAVLASYLVRRRRLAVHPPEPGMDADSTPKGPQP